MFTLCKMQVFSHQKVIITATSVTGRLTRSRHIYTHFARVILDTKRRAVGCYRLHVFEIASMYIHHNTSSLTERERKNPVSLNIFPRHSSVWNVFFSPSDYPMGWHLKKSETAQEKERGKYIYIYRKMTNIFRRWPFMSNCHSFRNKKRDAGWRQKKFFRMQHLVNRFFPPSSSANAPQRERDKCAQVYSLCKSD